MADHETPLVSILILNYNGKSFLQACFDSVLKTTYPNFEVILIDNASSDDSVYYTKTQYPTVKVFETGANLGFSNAYNESFSIANGKYFILLNNDITVEPDWLEPMVEAAEKDVSIGALQPKLVSMLNPQDFEYAGAAGGFMDIYGFPFLRGRVFNHIEKDKGQYDDEVRVFWTSGAAMFLRSTALKDTGLLDEDFFMHMEEIDLCWRLTLTGYQLKVIPQSQIYHYGGASLPAETYFKMYLNHRNSVLMLIKNLEIQNLKKILPKRFLLDFIALGQSLVKFEFKRVRAIIDAYLWILVRQKYLKEKRAKIQKIRVTPEEKIFNLLYPKSIALQYFIKGRKTYRDLMDAISENKK